MDDILASSGAGPIPLDENCEHCCNGAECARGPVRAPLDASLRGRLSERDVQAVGHLIAGAVMEAALVCATSDKPERAARDMIDGLLFILEPLLNSSGGIIHAD